MTIIHNIKHWLQTKIYHAWMRIDEEKEKEKLKNVLSQMKSHGHGFTVGHGYYINGAEFMEFGGCVYFGKDAWLECRDYWKGKRYTPALRVGKNFSMQNNCHIGCIESIEIGDNVLLGSKVYITDHFHGAITKEALSLAPSERPLCSKPVKIGHNVWIGDNVCIMPGVTLGDNVIVGANAVVTHSFLANQVIAGVPAKVIKVL